MRARVVPALVVLVLLVVAAPAAGGQGHLRQYARTTWASMAAMTDAASGLPADVLNADGTTSVQTVDHEHRRVHVERGRRAAARDHQARRARRPPLANGLHA